MLQNRRQTLLMAIGVFALIVVGLIGYAIYTSVTRAGKIPVQVATVPDTAQTVIDGKVYSNGTIYLPSNHTYEVTVRKEGFADYSQKIYIGPDQANININLSPVSDEAKKWAQDNQEKYLKAEGKAGKVANDEGAAFLKKNPITDQLPYENFIYSIGYRIDQSDPSGNTIILTIDAPEGARNAAVQQIRDLGYDPTDYKIEFSNYRNPFAL